MSLVLRDDENEIHGAATLEPALTRPATFHVYSELLKARFVTEPVFLPLGLEDAKNVSSIEPFAEFEAKRPSAPLAAASSTGLGIRVQSSAFMAANFIVYYDARITPGQLLEPKAPAVGKPPVDAIAQSLTAELANAAQTSLSPTNAFGRSTAAALGPHDSQRSRRIAVTLLLPRAASGKTRANNREIALLDAFALIAVSTNKQCFSVDSKGVPIELGSKKGDEVKLTDSVRMSVVAGSAHVASFARTIGIAADPIFASDEWRKNSIITFSYVTESNIVHESVLLDDVVSTPSTAVIQSIRCIHTASFRAQLQSHGKLVLPHGLLSEQYIAAFEEPDDCSDVLSESQFLMLQAEKQREFRRLHVRDLKVDIPMDVVRNITWFANEVTAEKDDFTKENEKETRPRFVRICNNRTTPERLSNDVECQSHCPGVLFSTCDELMLAYLNRNRLDNPPPHWKREWPPYGLAPPIDEEKRASISVLWLRLESTAIGSMLNLFFPRVQLGNDVTNIAGSRILSVVPVLSSIESVVCSGNFVLPCNSESMRPSGNQVISKRLCTACGNVLDDCYRTIASLGSNHDDPMRLQHSLSSDSFCESELDGSISPELRGIAKSPFGASASASSSPQTDEFFAALFSSRLGHPASTCGEAYSLLQEYSASDIVCSRAFHNLVMAGVSKLGANASMNELMEAATTALVEKMSLRADSALDDGLSDRKRARTPHGATPSDEAQPPPPSISGALRQNSLANLSDATVATAAEDGGSPKLIAPIPIHQDALMRHLNDELNYKRIVGIAGLSKFALPDFENGDAWMVFPLDGDAVQDGLEAIWRGVGLATETYAQLEEAGELNVAPPPNTPDTGDCTATQCLLAGLKFLFLEYHKLLKEKAAVDAFSDHEIFILLRPLHTDATLYELTASATGPKTTLVSTNRLLETPEKSFKLLFALSQPDEGASYPIKVVVRVYRNLLP